MDEEQEALLQKEANALIKKISQNQDEYSFYYSSQGEGGLIIPSYVNSLGETVFIYIKQWFVTVRL